MARFLEEVQMWLYIAAATVIATLIVVGCGKLGQLLWAWPAHTAQVAPPPQTSHPMSLPARTTLTCAGSTVVGNNVTNNNITIANQSDAPMQVSVIDGVTCVTRSNR